MNTLTSLLDYGQSYWLDNLTRKKIIGGELKKRVSQQGLRGITSNPSIFNKAISEGDSYDAQIAKLVKDGKTPQQIYDALTVKDVQDACDILKPVFDSSKGTDGFVSLEVSPYLAYNTQGTIEEARRLYKEVNRKNVLIKIPGTKDGLGAIEQALYEGININVTLLFSVNRYVEVAQAYVKALKRRAAENKSLDNIISVASFFLSRIDVSVDQLLSYQLAPGMDNNHAILLSSLFGKAGIASARLAYQRFKEIFNSSDWKSLEVKGAHAQRPLWASTSTKNPLYDDLRYVETLIGPDTVNTLPDETINALADHGELKKNTIEEGLDEANKLFDQLKQFDINIDFVTQQLESEGAKKFMEAYDKLLANLGKKREDMLGKHASIQQISFGDLKGDMPNAYAALDEKHAGMRLFGHDPYLWKTESDAVKSINNRLGWLQTPQSFMQKADELTTFAKQLKQEGYKHAVLLGMGGSSLCSEVARETFGTAKGYLELLVLDNTDPAAIRDIEEQIDLEKTLFIVASKSGGTKESTYFYKYFYSQLDKKAKGKAGKNFVAITDDGTVLVKEAQDNKFRETFINPGDIGGRYSVISYFGLLPMALIGIDIKGLLKSAQQLEASCDPYLPTTSNPGVSLGGLMGVAERHGRDKITFILSESIKSFGFWVEQLIAESTGKEGKGLIPINGEEAGKPGVYGNDRIFAHIYLNSDDNGADNKKVAALEREGNPVVRIRLADKLAIGGEFLRWEIATAISSVVNDINPFDEPNVAESKKNTDNLLSEWEKNGSFTKATAVLESEGLSVYAGAKAAAILQKKYKSVGALVNAFTESAKPGDYIAMLPYFFETEKRDKGLQAWRMNLRDDLKVATTLLTGPRYLHSTGQLHKGGPNSGLYIIFTADEEDLAIPGEKYGFATMNRAQALGDFRSLDDHGRRVIRIHLGKNVESGLKELKDSIKHGK